MQQAERLYKELSQKAEALQEREQALRQQQVGTVQSAIALAKGEIAQVIRRLQQGPVTAQDANLATNALEQIAGRHLPPPPPKQKGAFRPRVGDRVRIPKLSQTAEVLSGPDEDGDLTVRFGIMKMTIGLEDIESLDGQKAESSVKSKPAPAPAAPAPPPEPAPAIRTSKNTVDLRGSRVADAEMVLERAIAEAQGPLWIIHGNGTGRLRQGVHNLLQQHPRVSHYESAQPDDGGSGVTIAYVQ